MKKLFRPIEEKLFEAFVKVAGITLDLDAKFTAENLDAQIRERVNKLTERRPMAIAIGVIESGQPFGAILSENSRAVKLLVWLQKKRHGIAPDFLVKAELNVLVAPDGYTAKEFAAYLAERIPSMVTPYYTLAMYEPDGLIVGFTRNNIRPRRVSEEIQDAELGIEGI
jgi:hypothetical protein